MTNEPDNRTLSDDELTAVAGGAAPQPANPLGRAGQMHSIMGPTIDAGGGFAMDLHPIVQSGVQTGVHTDAHPVAHPGAHPAAPVPAHTDHAAPLVVSPTHTVAPTHAAAPTHGAAPTVQVDTVSLHLIDTSKEPVVTGTVTLPNTLPNWTPPADQFGPDEPTVQVMHFDSPKGQFTPIAFTVNAVPERSDTAASGGGHNQQNRLGTAYNTSLGDK